MAQKLRSPTHRSALCEADVAHRRRGGVRGSVCTACRGQPDVVGRHGDVRKVEIIFTPKKCRSRHCIISPSIFNSFATYAHIFCKFTRGIRPKLISNAARKVMGASKLRFSTKCSQFLKNHFFAFQNYYFVPVMFIVRFCLCALAGPNNFIFFRISIVEMF